MIGVTTEPGSLHSIDGNDFIRLCNEAGLDGKALWSTIWKHFKDKQAASEALNQKIQEYIRNDDKAKTTC